MVNTIASATFVIAVALRLIHFLSQESEALILYDHYISFCFML